MLNRTKARHQIVVAYLALFVALGGSAVAAKPLIDGADVQDESLTGADIQNDSLTGDDIVESSLGKVSSATTADSATTAGDAGTLDGKDSTDFLASNGIPGKVSFVSETYSMAAGTNGFRVAFCPEGSKAIAGGASWGSATQHRIPRGVALITSAPWTHDRRGELGTGHGWLGAGQNDTTGAVDFTVWAACAS